MQRRAGFTLVELLVSISIIAVVVAIGVASYATINKQSRDTTRKSDLEQVRAALEMYKVENGYYPSAGSGSWVVMSDPDNALTGLTPDLVSTYIPILPLDPVSDQQYMYVATNQASGNYYGYCVSADLEGEDPTDSCTPATGQNYGLKNP